MIGVDEEGGSITEILPVFKFMCVCVGGGSTRVGIPLRASCWMVEE
jgi:hypothetical protein